MGELREASRVAVIFDGGTRMGEAVAVVIRYVDSDMVILQRLVHLHKLAKSFTAPELAREIITVICNENQISPSKIVAAIREQGHHLNTQKVVSP